MIFGGAKQNIMMDLTSIKEIVCQAYISGFIVYAFSCTNAPNGAINFGSNPTIMQDGEFTTLDKTPRHKRDGYWLTDHFGGEHNYKSPIVFTSSAGTTEYCKIHHHWEDIRSRWGKAEDRIVFLVSKNKRSK
jgi:hypothetical protein